jgi:hypothetical protein
VDFNALIEFNKYTLALAAASFVYALEKFVPMPTDWQRFSVMAALLLFFLSTALGVVVFAAATAALGPNEARRGRIQKQLPSLGIAHAVTLILGIILLAIVMVPRVLAAPEPAAKCCCAPVQSTDH